MPQVARNSRGTRVLRRRTGSCRTERAKMKQKRKTLTIDSAKAEQQRSQGQAARTQQGKRHKPGIARTVAVLKEG